MSGELREIPVNPFNGPVAEALIDEIESQDESGKHIHRIEADTDDGEITKKLRTPHKLLAAAYEQLTDMEDERIPDDPARFSVAEIEIDISEGSVVTIRVMEE